MTVDLEALHNAATEHLDRRGIFDVDHYGWLNEDDVDPEFIGYAMWTTNPPYEHDFEAWQRNTPPGRAPTEVEQRLMELGHDFFGLMKTARHFIGFTLLSQRAVQPLRIEPTDFDFNEFAALVALTAASDRLRDFVIVAVLASKTDEKDQLKQVLTTLQAAGMHAEAEALTTEFIAVRRAREARNTAAHGLATEPARVQRQLIVRDRASFVERQWRKADDDAPHEELISTMAHADTEALAAVEARAQLLCDCYRGLLKMGEVCFRTEYRWRHRQKAVPGIATGNS